MVAHKDAVYQSACLAFMMDNQPLLDIQNILKANGIDGKWTSAEDFHITLMLATIDSVQMLEYVPQTSTAFSVIVDGIDQFETENGYAVYARVRNIGVLNSIQTGINNMIVNSWEYDVIPEHMQSMNWKPHITLLYSETAIEPYDFDPLPLVVDEISVFDAEHEPISRLYLKAANQAAFFDGDSQMEDKTYSFGSPVKAVSDNRVGGYLVVFSDANKRDLEGEYFTPETNFYVNIPDDVAYLKTLYNHGLKNGTEFYRIGKFVDARQDDLGIWVEAEIDLSNRYSQAIMKLVKEGRLGWSSGAIPHSVKVANDGRITHWALVEGSLTVSPAMPFETKIHSQKSLRELLLREGLGIDPMEAAVEAIDAAKSSDIITESTKMDPEEIRAIIRAEIAQQLKDMGVGADSADDMAENAINSTMPEDVKTAKLEDVLPKAIEEGVKLYKQWEKQQQSIKNGVASAFNDAKKSAPPVQPDLPANRDHQNSGVKGNTLSVGDDLRYAHLSAEDMAHGYLLLESTVPKQMRKSVPAASAEYIKAMTSKAEHYIAKDPHKRLEDNLAVKSAMRMGLKADEINATNISGQGQDWVGVMYGTILWEVARNEVKLLQMMEARGIYSQEIPQGHGSVKIPTEGSDPIAYSTPEANDLDAVGRVETTANIGFFGTGSATMTPGQIKIAAAVTDELDEDSIIPALPNMARQMRIKGVETLEQAMLNGDTETSASTNINLIDSTPGTGINRPYYLAVNGLRKYPLVTNTAYSRDAAGGLSIDDFRLTLAKFSAAPQAALSKLLFVIDVFTHNTALALSELATNDVRRTNATIESGRLLNIYGVDVLTTGFMGKANTAGKISNTGSNNTRGQVLALYAPYWAFGWKRNMRFETDRDIASGATIAVLSMRFGFQPRGADASAITYNVGIS